RGRPQRQEGADGERASALALEDVAERLAERLRLCRRQRLIEGARNLVEQLVRPDQVADEAGQRSQEDGKREEGEDEVIGQFRRQTRYVILLVFLHHRLADGHPI